MRPFVLTLRLLATAFIVVAGLHLFLGLHADEMLGVVVSPEMLANASLDSQNRFYGLTFSLLGVVLLIATTDLRRYAPMVLAVLGVLFMSGVARMVAWCAHGAPSAPLMAIACVDLASPVLLYFWFRRVAR